MTVQASQIFTTLCVVYSGSFRVCAPTGWYRWSCCCAGTLSTAGVPTYAERGRNGGFALLPGFRTELTGLNNDEALALLVSGSRRGAQVFGLGSALASAMLKVIDALPESQQAIATEGVQRLLIDPETDLLSRRAVTDETPDSVAAEIRRAVFSGHRLLIRYAALDQAPKWRTVEPIGLVTLYGEPSRPVRPRSSDGTNCGGTRSVRHRSR
ncbi:hypothetical protein EV641_11881 [Rhodococcus sp. SMB37]|nr:hypothetical protein EV641_11881 [Rhodococcus sp. SMB37]